jgi:hypothetical protein
LAKRKRELEGLGPSRQTEQEQRLFLSTMARQFQELVQVALNAHYSNYTAFEEKEELRLIIYGLISLSCSTITLSGRPTFAILRVHLRLLFSSQQRRFPRYFLRRLHLL